MILLKSPVSHQWCSWNLFIGRSLNAWLLTTDHLILQIFCSYSLQATFHIGCPTHECHFTYLDVYVLKIFIVSLKIMLMIPRLIFWRLVPDSFFTTLSWDQKSMAEEMLRAASVLKGTCVLAKDLSWVSSTHVRIYKWMSVEMGLFMVFFTLEEMLLSFAFST